MRRAVAALAVACACLGLAGPATADVRRATLGDVVANLTLTHHEGGFGNLRLSLLRGGITVFDGPITTAAGRPGSLERTPPVRTFLDVRLQVLDLDGDGTGEAVVDLAERGAYCCSHSVLVGAGEDGVYRPLELDWGSYGSAASYAPLERGYAIVAKDARLEERYTPHALSFEPVRIWSWSRGVVQDVSHAQPLLVQHDLSELRATRRRLLKRSDHTTIDFRALLMAIAGDRFLLGQKGSAMHALALDIAAGRARIASGGGPTNTAFARSMLDLLVRLGY